MKNTKYNKLVVALENQNISLPPDFPEKAAAFHEQVSTWNTYGSLLSQKDVAENLWDHTIDSLTLLPYLPSAGPDIWNYIDVGTGGGFPAIPILLATQGFGSVYLIERNTKKATYLSKLLRVLELDGVEVINNSFQDSEIPGHHRVFTARAVEKPAEIFDLVGGLMHSEDVFLSQLKPDRVQAKPGLVVEGIEDDLKSAGLRRGSLSIVTRNA